MGISEFDLFMNEADRLKRRGMVLRRHGMGQPVAYWHSNKRDGLCLSLFRNGVWLNVLRANRDIGHVEIVESPVESNTPLFGTERDFLPPIDAVFLLGSERVGAFLEKYDWPRDEPYNSNFPHEAPGKYEQFWQKDCPVYLKGVDAVVGGWHFPWPDGDWHDWIEHELVVWTLLEAEPWIEVFVKNSEFVVNNRIT